MAFSHSKRLIKGAWGRRWFRRITYALVSGSVIVGTGLWAVRQPFFDRWLIGKLGAIAREETGLGLQAEDLEFDLLQGRIILRGLELGGDLLVADRLEMRVDLVTLLGRNPHIWNLELENPRTILDAKRLARIRLKPRSEFADAPLLRLDRLAIRGGRLSIQEPSWRLPSAEFTYHIEGKGIGPNRLHVDLQVPKMSIGSSGMEGGLSAKANLSDLSVELKEAEIRLGQNRLSGRGNYALKEGLFTADARGALDLEEALRLMDPRAPANWRGRAEFSAEVRGSLADPRWSVSVHGRDLRSNFIDVTPGEATIRADGSLKQATVQELVWNSPQGKVSASGQWVRGLGSRMDFRCERVGLAPLAGYARVGFLKDLFLEMTGSADIPGDPWLPPRLDIMKITARGAFVRNLDSVGRVGLDLKDGVLTIDEMSLLVPELDLQGRGVLKLDKGGLRSIAAQGTARTDARHVAGVLSEWDIGERGDHGKLTKLGMSGLAFAQATVDWDPTQGIRLNGRAEVEEPRWHGASMDRLRADVTIQKDELRIDGIESDKGAGGASGSLWLTWRKMPPGQDQIDMCFQASRLPIEEGLRAGDVGDIPITGLGSGWARIHGPYDRLWIEAGGMAENAKVYGFRVPFASGDMTYDIKGDRLQITNARVTERADQLNAMDQDSTALLGIGGEMAMDLKAQTWQVRATGIVDSQPLGLPGPRFQAQMDANFRGPWVGAFGPMALPLGTLSFRRGRVFLEQQSLEGLEGMLETGEGALRATAGVEGAGSPVLALEAWPKGQGVTGTAKIRIAPDTADTAHLAARLTEDLLKDGSMELGVDWTWDPSGLKWQGRMDHLVASFDGFDLIQERPAHLRGNESALSLDLELHGKSEAISGEVGQFRVSGTAPLSRSAEMGVKLQGTAELSNLKTILDRVLEVDEFSLLADLKPEGNAQFDLTLGGPYDQPTLDGHLSLAGGRLQVRTYPQSVEDLGFNLRFKGRDVILLESDPLRGRVAQGELKAWGVATWEIGGLSSYDLQTHLGNFQLRDLPDGFELYGNLDAVLQGTKEEGGILSGQIQARHMLYRADVNLQDLILASAMGGAPSLRAADPNDPLTHIDLDLDLVLLQPWEFDTNLLKLQGRPMGTFKILGTLVEPGLKGKMGILPGGRLTNLLPAGDVVLERGTIEWTNPRVWYPDLDLQGRVDISPYVVNLGIRGSLDGLEMRQTSTPSLRQDEITAILIDPSLAPNIGGLLGPASQTAINYGLANTGSGLVTTLALANLQESLRRTLKLDRVSVAWRTGSGTGAPETSLTVGKSVNFFGHRTPLVLTHQKAGDMASTSGQVEWRFGNLVLLLGVSQSGANGAAPSGELRHTWSLGW